MDKAEINTEQRHLSKVIWFGTKTGGVFGFIDFYKNESNGIFFHKNQILHTSLSKLSKFTEDALVTFKVRESKKESGKLEAYDVSLLEDEGNVDFLLELFFTWIQIKHNQKQTILDIHERILELIIQPNFIKKNKHLNLITTNLDTIITLDKASLTLTLKLLSKLYYFEDLSIFEKVTDAYISLNINDKKTSSIKNLISEFSEYFEDKSKAFDTITEYLKGRNKQNIIHYLLWIDQLEYEIPLTYIIENMFLLNEKYEQGFLNNIENSYYSTVLDNLMHSFENETLVFDSYTDSKLFYQLLSKLNLHEYMPVFIPFTPPLIKIDLLLNEIIDDFDFNEYISCITILDRDKQQLFIKRLLHLIHTGSCSLSLNQISQIKLDDYSSMVAIQLLNKLNTTEKITKYSLKGDVLRLIADLVIDSNDVLSLNGYFDLCTGRTKESKRHVNISETQEQVTEYHYEKSSEAEFISDQRKEPIICEGKLSKSKNGKINLSEGGNSFWWCRNLPCFDACRVVKEASDWKKYSLLDFLNILKIDYDANDIELLYATINKVNKYLKHLNCRDCKRILKPVQDSRYAFDRVNTFSCDNSECHNEDQVYITHCSNGRCDDVIDSRDVAQCPNNWYICENCFACCATRVMYDRNQNLEINRQKLNQIPNTHRGKLIFCPNCGGGLDYKDPVQQAQEYQSMLETFENLANAYVKPGEQRLVGKHGTNKYNNKWFVTYQSYYSHEQYLKYLYYWQSLGFHIPDFPENENKTNYLVAEPIKKTESVTNFSCQNCQHTYDINSDRNRLNAVQYWHFPKHID